MSLEFKAIAFLALVAGAILGYAAWQHRVESRAVAVALAGRDAADAARLRENLAAQAEISAEASRMANRARDASLGLRVPSRRLFDALVARPVDCPSPPSGSASAPAQPDLRPLVLREIEDRLGALALEADLRGAAGRACERDYDKVAK